MDLLEVSKGVGERLAEREVSRASYMSRFLRKRVSVTPYLFLLPALVIYLTFLVYPAIYSLYLSLTEWDGLSPQKKFVGLQNYISLWGDPVFRLALRNNVIWTVVTLLVPTIGGLALAVALNQPLRGRNLFRAVFYAPGVLPLVAVASIWGWIYNPNFGFINEMLRHIGLGSLAHGWLADYDTALPATLVTAIWQGIGLPMMFYLAGLQVIPQEQYEAAAIDGANAWQRFWHITLPWLSQTHVIVITLAVISSFRVFDLIYAMTYGGPGQTTQVLATWMYFNTFQYYHAGYGSAIAWVIAGISLLVTIPYIRLMARSQQE